MLNTVRSIVLTAGLAFVAASLVFARSRHLDGPPDVGPITRWAVCYSTSPTALELADYDLVVVDADRHPPIAPVVERGKTVLAYLALTQIGQHRQAYPYLKKAGLLIGMHPQWTDAAFVDIRRPEWTRLVLDELVPHAIADGFTGLFLDTLDDAEMLEAKEPVRYRGMQRAAANLVKAIRQRYPQLVLMVNRGYALVPEIAPSVDILLGESVLSTFDGATKAYRRVTPSDIAWQRAALERARTINPRLKLFTLDYWDPADADGVRELYRAERTAGYVPYVSTPDLDVLVREPR